MSVAFVLVLMIPDWVAAMKQLLRRYARNVLVAIDQFANALTGGDPDETISSRAAKRQADCRLCRWLCRLLDRIQPGHCAASLEPDEGGDSLG